MAMTAALTLATRLRDLDDETLSSLLAEPGIPVARIGDVFDLADALLGRERVSAALRNADRGELLILRSAADGALGIAELADVLGDLPARLGWTGADAVAERAVRLAERALLETPDAGASWRTPPPVAEVLDDGGSPDAEALRTHGPERDAPLTESAETAGLASERALVAVAAVSEMLRDLAAEPARILAKGGLAQPPTRRLAETMELETDDVAPLVDLVTDAGLVGVSGGAHAPTDEAGAWLELPLTERWLSLARAWAGRMPGSLAHRSAAEEPARLVAEDAWHFPLADDAHRASVRQSERVGQILGTAIDGVPSALGHDVLVGDGAAAVQALAERLPPTIDSVYLQNDLTVIAPGPLEAGLESRLRALADAEARGLASSYRISEASLFRALGRGESADGILAFLEGISLTGIPQPLRYLIEQSARRHGSIRIGPDIDDPTSGRALIRTDDATTLDTMGVDRALASLMLRRTSPTSALARFEPAVVYWSMRDARYPVVLVDADDAVLGAPLRNPPAARIARSARPKAVSDAVARIRSQAERDNEAGDDGWILRQLEQAIKIRARVRVTVSTNTGEMLELELEPSGLGGGRLRGRDRLGDVERTLPLSRIVDVSPVDDGSAT